MNDRPAAVPPFVDALLAEFMAESARRGGLAALLQLAERLQTHSLRLDDWAALLAGLLRGGFAEEAAEIAALALRSLPQNPQLHYWRGNALRVAGRPDDAELELRAALRNDARHRDAALSLAFMLREQGRYDAAAQILVASAQARDAQPAELQATIGFLRECGAFGAGYALLRAAHARWPDNLDIAAAAGEFALAVGEFEQAQRCLAEATRNDPRKGASWLRLSRCRRFTARSDEDVQRFEKAWRDRGINAQTRTCVGFALGKALDDLEDHAGAVQVLHEANARATAASPWNRTAWDAFVTQQRLLPPLPKAGDDSFTPVFVVGLPRTGTTLAASLLARDTQVRDRGELNWIGAMHAHLQSQEAFYDRAALRTTAAIVATHMRRDDAPAHFYLDKNPLNFRYLDLIAALFPRAKIVHCRRDLRDTALSLWMQHFDHADLGFAYDFADIAAYARGYETLMAHWRETLAVPIFELDYAALAGATDATLRRLGEFIGCDVTALSSDVAPAHAIATASVWQARQPVYATSIGRWQRYATYLPELAAI